MAEEQVAMDEEQSEVELVVFDENHGTDRKQRLRVRCLSPGFDRSINVKTPDLHSILKREPGLHYALAASFIEVVTDKQGVTTYAVLPRAMGRNLSDSCFRILGKQLQGGPCYLGGENWVLPALPPKKPIKAYADDDDVFSVDFGLEPQYKHLLVGDPTNARGNDRKGAAKGPAKGAAKAAGAGGRRSRTPSVKGASDDEDADGDWGARGKRRKPRQSAAAALAAAAAAAEAELLAAQEEQPLLLCPLCVVECTPESLMCEWCDDFWCCKRPACTDKLGAHEPVCDKNPNRQQQQLQLLQQQQMQQMQQRQQQQYQQPQPQPQLYQQPQPQLYQQPQPQPQLYQQQQQQQQYQQGHAPLPQAEFF